VRLWDLLNLETQMTLIHLGFVDPDKVGVDTAQPIPNLVLFESGEQLERIMQEKPNYTIFMPPLRGLRSPKVLRGDRAHHR